MLISDGLTFAGAFDIVTRRGATLRATFVTDTSSQPFVATIQNGTGRFTGATGTLALNITRFNETNCDPRVGICFNWDERITITGTITRPRHGPR